MAVAKLQRDLHQAVKSDPVLKKYPVWSISEKGAERDNVGLQFLTIPNEARTLMPEGTRKITPTLPRPQLHLSPRIPGLMDNKTWNAADPTPACKVDGLYGNYGLTWGRKFPGYTVTELQTLPRVTTETGCKVEGQVTEEIHALNLLSMYLDQFKRGWSHTSVYLLRDRTDEGGNQSFGFFKPDYTPRKAAVYLHNLTTILADHGTLAKPGQLDYSIPEEPVTVHDLLLQNSDGTFQLLVWGERLKGADRVTVRLGGTHASVKVFDPTVGTEPVRLLAALLLARLNLERSPRPDLKCARACRPLISIAVSLLSALISTATSLLSGALMISTATSLLSARSISTLAGLRRARERETTASFLRPPLISTRAPSSVDEISPPPIDGMALAISNAATAKRIRPVCALAWWRDKGIGRQRMPETVSPWQA